MASVPKSTLESFPAYVQAIGMISVEMGNLELCLGELLAALLMIQTFLGQAVYLTPRAAIGRIEVLDNVIRITMNDGSAGRKVLESLTRRAKTVIGKRHSHIHYAWGTSKDNPDEVSHVSLPVVNDPSGKVVSIDELNRLVKDIRQLAHDLQKPIHDLREMWPPEAWNKRGGTPDQKTPVK